MSATMARPGGPVPVQLTPLLGRDREAARLRTLLADRETRLVTLTGPGGVGKTRLALHVAASLHDEGRDVAFVPLASITDPALVPSAVLRGLGAIERGTADPTEQLVDLLADRELTLVLDNLEQVRDAASTLADVLVRCPGVRMLATSQATLGITGEHRFLLEPLGMPLAEETQLEAIASADAVALFAERARAANPAFRLDGRTAPVVAAICRRLDGLPLAIELAAARTRVLSPEALLARLSDRFRVLGGSRQDVPDRLRTMRNAVAWTYDLLTPDEQRLFRRLSVFAGGVSLEAVEATHTPGAGGRPAFDVLGALVDHSLVTSMTTASTEPRFYLLQTLRDFGLDQLATGGEEAEARMAHASWFIELSEAARPQLSGRGQAAWLERLLPEVENIRSAAEWLFEIGREDLVLRLIGPIWRFYSTQGFARGPREWLRRALDATATQNAPGRAIALLAAGNLFEDLRQLDIARGYFEEARDLAAAGGDALVESQASIGLGIIAHDAGEYGVALPLHQRALELARASGDQHLIGRALGNLGAVSYYQGRLDDAERCWEEARTIMGETGDTVAEATSTSNLGALAFELGDLDRSEQMHRRALELQRRMRSTRDIPYTLLNIAGVATLRRHFELAHASLAEAIALLREAGNTAIEGIALNVAAGLALAEGNVADCASLLLDSMRLVDPTADQRAVIENAEMLADACIAAGRFAASAELLAAAVRARDDLGAAMTPAKEKDFDRMRAAILAGTEPAALAEAESAGSRLGFESLPRRMATIAHDLVGERREPVRIAAMPVEQPVDYGLTAREREVLRLLTEGRTTDEIADHLFISPRTCTTHLTHIMAKLDVPTRTAAVALAIREGIA